ncbi:hypothetical protein QBC33DRAFT_573607 [Phialemonium atrogriseum]|uniref:Fucose-specific lectin n=1 Tax=Phialemonium atrogriseum TaxID=1093897 RepID=A0AAJ0BRU6_9PEZI|nr:uncharacterized protein QBC33DRAFT_573607 [Phialemonium atrogriseum]KAK1763090.1 hypothetical protein QBC33DRAFT_573607 [Phialemonium atrogriseum]
MESNSGVMAIASIFNIESLNVTGPLFTVTHSDTPDASSLDESVMSQSALPRPWLMEIPVSPNDEPEMPTPYAIASTYYPASQPFSEPKECVYFQSYDNPSTIVELCRGKLGWYVAELIDAPDAASCTRLAALSYPGSSMIHLFYVTTSGTICDLAWSPGNGWSAGYLTAETAPKISPWSSLSALRSANCAKLYYQRDTKLCELAYDFNVRELCYTELANADRGTAIASVSYAGSEGTSYHVFYQDDGMLWEHRSQGEVLTTSSLPSLTKMPPQRTSLSAISWFTQRAYIRLYYTSETGQICELLWDERAGWKQRLNLSDNATPNLQPCGGAHISAMQMDRGDRIRVYRNSSPEGLVQMAFSKTSKNPKVRALPASK